VRVDAELGLVRLNRFVGAYDAGRIIKPQQLDRL
jgi:xanthine dehydrogenase YagR molybdenum-binding subunit